MHGKKNLASLTMRPLQAAEGNIGLLSSILRLCTSVHNRLHLDTWVKWSAVPTSTCRPALDSASPSPSQPSRVSHAISPLSPASYTAMCAEKARASLAELPLRHTSYTAVGVERAGSGATGAESLLI